MSVLIEDSHRWDRLASSYNYPSSNRRKVFVDLVRGEAQRLRGTHRRVDALDIGCGTGISEDPRVNAQYLASVREAVDSLEGVEPDPTVRPAHGLFAAYYPTTLEALVLPSPVELAYSYMVQEHLEDPASFFRALSHHLAPGGVYLGLTINARHAFARVASTLHRLRIDERALALVRPGETGYHYPVRYRANDPATLTALARDAGFLPPTFVTLEKELDTIGYFPGPLRPAHWLLQWKRRVIRQPESLLTLIVRAEKPR